jgi:hypothetical protein
MKESFTDGNLISLALSGDREAITDICGLLAERADGQIENQFIKGVKLIGQGLSPDGAFAWGKKQLRQGIKDEARDFLKGLSPAAFHGDQDLFFFAITVLKKLKTGRSPTESFGWNQIRRGRPRKNTALRDWEIRMTVHTLMKEYGATLAGACGLVMNSIPDSENRYKTIEAIARGVNANECPQFPENPFPISSDKSLNIDVAELMKSIDLIMH